MLSRLPVILLLAASLSVFHPGLVNAADPAKPKNDKPAPEKVEVQEKFIWGIVVNVVLSSVFSMFGGWLKNRLTQGSHGTAPAGGQGFSAAAAATVNTTPKPMSGAVDFRSLAVDVGIAILTGGLSGKLNSALLRTFTGKDANLTTTPKTPFQVKNGDPNYQAAHIAIMAVDENGNVTGFRSVTQGFRSGERFKVRVVSTFDALVAIGNVNPSGKQKQIYPAENGAVVTVKLGVEAILPLKPDEFFEFTGEKGAEQLVVTVLDPRALEGNASKARVHRQDVDYGSNFAQEVAPDTYPVISQPIALTHY